MKRSRSAALAALCVLALALGAATLTSPVADDGGLGGAGSGGLGDAPSDGPGGSTAENGTRDLGAIIPFRGLCIPFFTSAEFFASLAIGTLLVGVVLNRKGGPLLVVGVFGALFAPGLLLWMLVTTCGQPALPDRAQNFTLFPGQNGTIAEGVGGGGGPGSSMPTLATTVLLVLGLAVVLVSLVLLRASGGDEAAVQAPTSDPDPAGESLAGLARVAGSAADRIESDGSTENEVYRAWREMTTFLDVSNPRASTPAEFRDAARDAGMAPRHVEALTDLFRAVRYGGEPATADRETAAVDARRAIEAAYGGGDES